MNKAGGIIAMVAGVFSVIAAFVTLTVGGSGSAFKADNADTVVALGWGGVVFSFLVIVLGAVAFFKPKSAGLGLIVCSIAGAILGGTIVAIFMVLSLVGGILCMAGSKRKAGDTATLDRISPVDPTQGGIYLELEKLAGLRDQGVLTEAEFQAQKLKVLTGSSSQPTDGPSVGKGNPSQPTAASQSRSRTRQWVLAGVGMLFAIVIGVAVVSSSKNQASGKSPAGTDPLVIVANTTPANIAPDGEVAKIFTLGSDYTDLQRENKLTELKDQIVAWNLPVYEVKRDGDGYTVQTSNHRVVGTFVYLTARNDEERRFIEQLKTGDTIPIKGRIAGSSFRNLVIKTAILNNGLYISSQTSQSTPVKSVLDQQPVVQFDSITSLINGEERVRGKLVSVKAQISYPTVATADEIEMVVPEETAPDGSQVYNANWHAVCKPSPDQVDKFQALKEGEHVAIVGTVPSEGTTDLRAPSADQTGLYELKLSGCRLQ